MGRTSRAVFLDRDGVINRAVVRNGKPFPPATLAEFELYPGVPEAVRALKSDGYRIIVVTNQPDVATGKQRREVVEAMHQRLCRELPIDAVKVCYHVDADDCSCRKPKAGMILEAAMEWFVDLKQSYMVGDRWRDIAAGKTADCTTILVRGNYEEQEADSPDAVVDSLFEASEWILRRNRPCRKEPI